MRAKKVNKIILRTKENLRAFIALVAAFGLVAAYATPVVAATLTSASVTLSDSRPSTASTSYDFKASSVTASAIKCIRMEFDTAADGSGSKPTGMNITSAALSASSDYIPTPGSWSVSNNDTTGVSSITFATGETPASATDRNVILTGITNGSTADTGYFLRVNTYNNVDCTSSPVDATVVEFIYTAGQSVSLSVDPSLSFTVAGATSGTACNGANSNVTTTASTIPFGTVTSSTNKVGVQNLTVTTNAGNGYSVATRYTAPPTSGSNTIDDHSGTNGSPTAFSAAGTEAFGYTTNDSSLSTGPGAANRFTSTPNVWAAYTTSNAEVSYSTAAVSNQTTCVGHQVGIAGTTPAGTYTTTVIYTATPIY